VREVPRLVEASELSREQQGTAAAFGYSWMNYGATNPYTEEQWADWIHPLVPADFVDKIVLDAGCGLAGFADYALKWGARQVVGVDVSEAIDGAQANFGDRLDLAQADIHRLPFAPGTFDIAYSIGVLHHLEDPAAGFAALARMVRPGGVAFAWVYGRENNEWIIKGVNPVREKVLARLPPALLKWGVALPAAAGLYPLTRLARRGAPLPYGPYLGWLGESGFGFVHGVVFDHLVAPTAHYISQQDFRKWFTDAGLERIELSWRNRNSWRGVGRVPLLSSAS
jgi:SAM-dependent methyltransferase